MQQSNVIAGYIFAAFLIYITLKGELPTYMGFLLSSAPSSYAPPTASVAPVGAQASTAGGASGGKSSGGMPDFGGLAGGILGGGDTGGMPDIAGFLGGAVQSTGGKDSGGKQGADWMQYAKYAEIALMFL